MDFDFNKANKILFPDKDMGKFEEIFKNFTSKDGKELIKELGESYSDNKKISDLCKKLCGEKTSKGKEVIVESSKDLFYRLYKLADRLKDEKADEYFIKNLRKAYENWLTSGNEFEALDVQYAEYLSKSRKILLSYRKDFEDINKVAKASIECANKLEELRRDAEKKESSDLWKNYTKNNKDHDPEWRPTLSSAVPHLMFSTRNLGVGCGPLSDLFIPRERSNNYDDLHETLIYKAKGCRTFSIGLKRNADSYNNGGDMDWSGKFIVTFLKKKGQKRAEEEAGKLSGVLLQLANSVERCMNEFSKQAVKLRAKMHGHCRNVRPRGLSPKVLKIDE